jgi:hypothetical protein
MEKKQLQQWLNDIDKAIAEERLHSTNQVFWPGSSNFIESPPYQTHVNTFSGSSQSKTDRSYSSHDKIKKTIEQKRQEKIDEELDQLKSPALSKKTQQMIFKAKREGKVEDRLLQESQKRKQEASEKEAKLRLEAKQKSQPIITPLAASLKREGDVAERLIDYQKVYQEKKEMLKKEIEPENVPQVPKINKSNVESRYLKPFKPNLVPEEYSYKPEISGRSAKLAAKLGESKDRLLQKNPTKSVEDLECTFTPSIIKREDNENKIWWENLYQQSKIIQEKKEKQKEDFDKQRQENPECTFKPKLQSYSDKKENPEERVKRLQDWQKSREDRLKLYREQNNAKGLEECTFAPKVFNT